MRLERDGSIVSGAARRGREAGLEDASLAPARFTTEEDYERNFEKIKKIKV